MVNTCQPARKHLSQKLRGKYYQHIENVIPSKEGPLEKSIILFRKEKIKQTQVRYQKQT